MGSDRNSLYSTIVLYIIVVRIDIIIIIIKYCWRKDEWLEDISLFPHHIY
jgi:hypothetical protein